MRDAAKDWRGFAAATIPSKEATPHLDRFLTAIQETSPPLQPVALLDVGCGTGRLGRRLYDRGFSVTGVDVNPDAIRMARELVPIAPATRALRFAEADFAADRAPQIDGGPFDVVVCQLVLSIIGAARHRDNLLRHIRAQLRDDGWLYLSASGVSDTINAGYARLYAADAPAIGEQHSYFSRDAAGGILYMTHHFTAEELVGLLAATGFGAVTVHTAHEASSRRPDEAAYFHYVTCRRA